MSKLVVSRPNTFDEEEDSEIAELEALLEPEVVRDESFDSIIVVDNVPGVEESKRAKLEAVLGKVLRAAGRLVPDGIHMPMNPDTGKSEGFVFAEYETMAEAHEAVKKLNGYKLDAKHTFRAVLYTDFDRYMKLPNEYVEKEYPPFEPKCNPYWWLNNPKATDQYAIGYGDETEIYWNETSTMRMDPLFARTRWSDSYIQWSPRGTYLTTFHAQGVILWAGEKWVKIHQFTHPKVKLVDFSPCENYLVTFASASSAPIAKGQQPNAPARVDTSKPADSHAIAVWDIRTGERVGNFAESEWPAIKWSFDDKYFARLSKNGISVYETETMALLDKRSFKLDNCTEFHWSPTEHIISAWMPEREDHPARILLIEIPSRREVASKTIFNVIKHSIHWQEQGHFLCLKVDRFAKTRKQTMTNFELFRMKQKNIPIESMELKDNVPVFAWEPIGKRFAIIHHEAGREGIKPNVSFYDMSDKVVKKITTLETRSVNQLHWSPKGSNIILAGLGTAMHGTLEFYNVDLQTTMGERVHGMATDVSWDPSGQFICTFVSAWRINLETGYILWSFQGVPIRQVLKDRFFQFLWRPRPPTLLSLEEQRDVKQNLSKSVKSFRRDEELWIDDDVRAEQEKRKNIVKEYQDRVATWQALFEQENKIIQGIRGVRPDMELVASTTETVEEVLSVTEEPYTGK